MAEITREEFQKIYDEKFVPILKDIELERVETLKKAKKRAHIIGLLFLVISSFLSYNIFIVNSDPSEIIKALFK